MSDWKLQLYHRLPSPIRSVAASLRGMYLRSWRYGPETERLLQEALERESWSAARWHTWQQERLAYVLHRAATQVPYYREQWAARRRNGDRASWEKLANWPILTKEKVRNQPEAFVANDCNVRYMFTRHTSGSSGTPLSLWWSKSTTYKWYALFEVRWRHWNNVSRYDRWAILGGQLVTPIRQHTPPFWVWNAGMNQLYMSSYHLAPENVSAYLKALHHYRVTYVFGYASSMYALAQMAVERGLQAPWLKVAISNAEPLYQHQRDTISQVFQCPVRDTYGMGEIVCAASECQSRVMHLWPEVGIVEVLHDDADVPCNAEESGRIIGTGILNVDMPLIRYEVGDRGAIASTDTVCSCGRKLPILSKIEGRLDDVILTPEGRTVGRLDPVFKGDIPVREAQIIQESQQQIRICFVPASGYTEQDGLSIVQRLRDRVGDMAIVLEPVEAIPRAANGKFRTVVSKVHCRSCVSDVDL